MDQILYLLCWYAPCQGNQLTPFNIESIKQNLQLSTTRRSLPDAHTLTNTVKVRTRLVPQSYGNALIISLIDTSLCPVRLYNCFCKVVTQATLLKSQLIDTRATKICSTPKTRIPKPHGIWSWMVGLLLVRPLLARPILLLLMLMLTLMLIILTSYWLLKLKLQVQKTNIGR